MNSSDDRDGNGLVDPTDVVGRRMAGWLIDLALVTGIVLVVLVLLGDSFERPGPDTGLELRRVGSDTAIFFRSTVAVIHNWEWLVAAGTGVLTTFLLLIVLPARWSWTPGLLAAELRLVDREGAPVGLRSAIVRFVGWIIDILPGVPLVGLAAMRFGRHHQRVGDRLARTYVVDREFAGRPPTEPAPVDAEGQVTTILNGLAPAEHEGAADGEVSDRTTVQRGYRRNREDPTVAPAPPGAGGRSSEESAWASDDGPSGPPDGVVADQPTWDRDKNEYVMWHGPTGQWVSYDATAQRWKPQ